MKLLSAVFILLFFTFSSFNSYCWGFFAHQRINRLAIFTLPIELVGFYKQHIQYITENAVAPDRRRYAVKYEAPRHYIDIDAYGDNALQEIPRSWTKAVELYTEDTLVAYGIVPWHIYVMKNQLTEAFRVKDVKRIIKLSTEMGHYIGDAHVPLHTTKNYNGQYTNQKGIHGLWESRLPEIFSDNYDYFIGQATYIENPQLKAWEAVTSAHNALDSVLIFESELTDRFPQDKKYSFEERNGITTKVYSKEFCEAYHNMLSGQVERQIRASIKMIGDFWYTCWVDAGQPTLSSSKEKQVYIESIMDEFKDIPVNNPHAPSHESEIND
ncbi:MAG: zinc dependent phospholipase C family protein [Bacteroidota bacterium]|nr:zinc dependent phospholipase C family protein [Bacteroidota bacterium]